MALSKETIRNLYRERAKRYDITANLYYLLGFRVAKYRKMAVSELRLKPGDTAVEIGCGTGLNFRYVRQCIGDAGQLIALDLTDAMLEQARARVQRHGWQNIRLAQTDAAEYSFPADVSGVLSTFALTLVPEYQTVIERASHALVKGGRFVVLDLKRPARWPLWALKIGVAITTPFGVTLDLGERKPWEAMKTCFHRVTVTELFGGFAYIAVGEK